MSHLLGYLRDTGIISYWTKDVIDQRIRAEKKIGKTERSDVLAVLKEVNHGDGKILNISRSVNKIAFHL